MNRRTLLAGGIGALLAACGLRDDTADPRTLPDAAESVTPTPPPDTPSPETSPRRTTPEQRSSDTAAVGGLAVLCREAWGARPVGPGLVEHSVERMMVHHTATVLEDNTEAPGRLRRHQRYHQEQGLPDIAYHLGVDRAGHVYALRPAGSRGDTFTDYDPTGWLLVVALGHFDRQSPSDAQIEGVARTLAWGGRAFGAPLETLAGHREHAATSCPGDALQAALPAIRARAAEILAAGGLRHEEICGQRGRARVEAITAGRA